MQVDGRSGVGKSQVGSPPANAADLARQAVLLAQTDPRRARGEARRARHHARGDAEVISRAERALGLAAKELNDLTAAEAHLRRAVAVARRGGLAVAEGEARMSLALTLLYQGKTAPALREADLAAPSLRGGEAARLQMQRALILARLGRQEEALDGYRRALAVFRQLDDRLWEARLLTNRGVLHAYRLELATARADLERAHVISTELGQDLMTGGICHNLGFVEARAGDVPAALYWYDQADTVLKALDVSRAVLLQDRGETLLSVGLYREGREAAAQAVAELDGTRMAADLAEARLMLAQAALLEGDHTTARAAARLAERAFTHQQRRSWAVLARYLGSKARWQAGERSPASLVAARRLADDLSLAGWAIPALDARLMAGRIALDLGRTDAARVQLAGASRARQRGPVEIRVRAWHAEALLRLAEGDRRGADQALLAGSRLVHQYRQALGASELRAHSASHGVELAALGVRLAVEDGRPERILAWAERARAGALLGRAARPPEDDALLADLAELRHLSAELDASVGDGRPTARLARRQAELEDAVRRRARQARCSGEGSAAVGEPPAIDLLRSQLGDAALVELVDTDGTLRAIVVGPGRPWVATLGPTAQVAAEVDSLRFALRRQATGHGSAASLEAAVALFDHAVDRLQAQLVGPLTGVLADRPLVLVPTGPLHALPWGALPALAGRPVAVAPSAAIWLAAATAASTRAADSDMADGRTPPGTTLVAGPRLAGAAAEIAELADRYPHAEVLTGPRATVGAVTAAVGGAGLVHIAAHGIFRADNPLFSSLTLADGALTVYDLERLETPPTRMVLSSCDAGLSAVRPGDALMGLAAALLDMGTETLVASVAPVPDVGAQSLMADFHARLSAGVGPAAALAGATASMDAGDPGTRALRAGFVCFGHG